MKMFSKRHSTRTLCLCLAAVFSAGAGWGAEAPKGAPAEPDVLILANGDTLHGKLVKEIAGAVTFHSDALGDVTLPWAKIKELHTSGHYGVLPTDLKLKRKKQLQQIPAGTIDVENQTITLHDGNGAAARPIPVKDAQYIVDTPTLETQIDHAPNFFTGWNGSATAGGTLVESTQNQYTVTGALSLMRAVPSVSWLATRNRTAADFSGSFGKITEPGTPSVKSAIYHVDGERDEYVSSRLFALGQLSYDHNYALNLQLQQIYGGGMGWTVMDTPRHEADLKATLQYEKQQFMGNAPGSDLELVGSTFSASYALHAKKFTYTQGVAFIPAYNTPRAYSATETDMVAFPAYKNFSFSLGTMDTYLNDPPLSTPPTKRNSFQFTMGLTYAIKSKY